jgi:hypothetical protein
MFRRGGSPDQHTCFVDPAGLPFITRYGPCGAGGASGAIYSFLGISSHESFPKSVVAKITAPTHAAYHVYNTTVRSESGAQHQKQIHTIHAVGPNFGQQSCTWKEALNLLGNTYANVLAEFANTPSTVTTLRLLPISGGIFAGSFKPRLPELTKNALAIGWTRLSPEMKRAVAERKVQMCIFEEQELRGFKRAFATATLRSSTM